MKHGSSIRPKPTDSIDLLEILRFISCVGVILYHYQHFVIYRGAVYESEAMPLHSVLKWFYQNGDSGVQVFWCLSGIVFAHVYQTALMNRNVRPSDFIWRRFARLYPLHLATLIIACVLQWLLRTTSDLSYFIYKFNDLKHFVLNIVFANYWGFQEGTSFNGPVWSVSVELLAYMVFLFVAISVGLLPRVLRSILLLLVLWSGVLWISFSRITTSSDFIEICVSLFMVGAILYTAWRMLPNVAVLLVVAYLTISYQTNDITSRWLEVLGVPFTSLMIAIFIGLLHFSTIFSRLKYGRFFAMNLGKVTYTMYMIHFPIQLLMVLFSENIKSLDFLSLPVFICFFALTVSLAYPCYTRFELPTQKLLRSLYARKKLSV